MHLLFILNLHKFNYIYILNQTINDVTFPDQKNKIYTECNSHI